MKKILLKSLLLGAALVLLISAESYARQDKLSYRLMLEFNSECCGVPSDAPLLKFIRSFKKQHKLKRINWDHISPMGKEGEYFMAFRLNDMNQRTRLLFIRQVKRISPNLKDKGSVRLRENVVLTRDDLNRNTTVERKFL